MGNCRRKPLATNSRIQAHNNFGKVHFRIFMSLNGEIPYEPQAKRHKTECTLGKLLNKRKHIDWEAISCRIRSHPRELSESIFRRAIRKPNIPLKIVREFLNQSQRSLCPNQRLLKISTLWFAWFKVRGIRLEILTEMVHAKSWDLSPRDVTGILLIRALDKTNRHRPSYLQVELLIDMFPLCLSYIDGLGQIPLHVAMKYEKKNHHLIELLIKKGIQYNVGGTNGRGGLFVQDHDGNTASCALTNHTKLRSCYSERLLQLVLGGEYPLMREDDIIQFDLLHSAVENNDFRLVFLMVLRYPTLLTTLDKYGDLPIHAAATSTSMHCSHDGPKMFFILLWEGLRHNVGGIDALGGLLVKNMHSSALDIMVENALKYGWDYRAFILLNHFESIVPKFLLEIIGRSTRAFKSLLLRFPMYTRSRDSYDRLLIHHAISYGLEWKGGCEVVLQENRLAIKEPDGLTGLLPFMLAGVTAPLNTIYSLLRSYPEALY